MKCFSVRKSVQTHLHFYGDPLCYSPSVVALWLSKEDQEKVVCYNLTWPFVFVQVKFTSAVKLSEGGGPGGGLDNGRDEEENFFKRLGKWRTCRRHPSKLHHTEEKDG